MNKKDITPNLTQPVERMTTGQLPSALAELEETTLEGGWGKDKVLPAGRTRNFCCQCSYDGDDAE